MINRDVCEYVSSIEPHKNDKGEEYISNLCVKESYGQTCGGYLKDCKKIDTKLAEPSQQEHFLYYYCNKAKMPPTYYYLRCPQLLLFIAEIAGIPRENLKSAYKILQDYENNNELAGKEKNGNYMWGKQAFRDFKSQIYISELVKIIKGAENWNEVRARVKDLE